MKGKNGDYPLPLFDSITWSKYQVRMIKKATSANRIPIEAKSEYRSYVPSPKGRRPPEDLTKRSYV